MILVRFVKTSSTFPIATMPRYNGIDKRIWRRTLMNNVRLKPPKPKRSVPTIKLTIKHKQV